MAEITVYGAPWCPDCKRSKRFLSEQRVSYRSVDIDQDAAGLAAVERLQGGGRTIPTIVFGDGSWVAEPSDEELARRLGLTLEPQRLSYDLAIVGGGPAGLAAAIYAAREGIDAIVIDSGGLGGQAGVTERIDNYPGFPEGISGAEIADRFIAHAKRYRVELLAAVGVERLAREGDDVTLTLSSGREVCAHAVIVATGSTYRRLGVPGEEDLIGAGVHFCATCDGPFYRGADELAVIGGGNSALEEGMFLTQFAKKVVVLQLLPELTASRTLREKVENDPRFEVHLNTAVKELRGTPKLEEIVALDQSSGEELRLHPAAVFVFIGLHPNTQFVRGTLDLDEHGFVRTDAAFTTSMPGVFAAGDVRSGSTKQLGSAVGDGIAALIAVRRYLEAHHEVPHIDAAEM